MVAITDPLAPRVAPAPQPPVLLASGEDDINRLTTMNGIAFDALCRSSQMGTLRQLGTLYRDYIQNGDDDALRALALRAED